VPGQVALDRELKKYFAECQIGTRQRGDLTPLAHTRTQAAARSRVAEGGERKEEEERQEEEKEEEEKGGWRKKEEEEEETPRPPLPRPRPRPPSLYTKRPRDWVKPKPSELGDCTTIMLRNIPNKLR